MPQNSKQKTSRPQVLVDAVVHAVNEDYENMAGDFIKLGFLTPGTDITPIVPALEKIWRDSKGQSLADFNFRCAVCAACCVPWVAWVGRIYVVRLPYHVPWRLCLIDLGAVVRAGAQREERLGSQVWLCGRCAHCAVP